MYTVLLNVWVEYQTVLKQAIRKNKLYFDCCMYELMTEEIINVNQMCEIHEKKSKLRRKRKAERRKEFAHTKRLKGAKKNSVTWQCSDEKFKEYVADSRSWSQLAKYCGYRNVGNNKTLKKRIVFLHLDTTHFCRAYRSSNKQLLKDIMVKDSTYTSRKGLKNRLKSELKWVHKCSRCKLTEWEGQPISIELDHINGVNDDHRLENLRFLCPNCHALTPTYRGRNRNK